MSTAYRPDIDGLRAIAVGAVVLFHAGVPWMGGGYVGVDVFFVISGYLITTLIAQEMDQQCFSILRFYDRRVRRIFPALFAALALCSIAAPVLLLPSQLEAYGRSLAAACLFFSNIEFWSQAGYFDGPGIGKPLLHTWSLAVEEQYYLLWPLLLWGLLRLRPRARAWQLLLGLSLLSLALAEWLCTKSPKTAFFWLPPRAWELGLGALLALWPPPQALPAAVHQVAGVAGLGLIAWTCAQYQAETRFPGLGALAPCVGAALIIWSGAQGDSWTRRLLASRPMVAVGLLSYSLYLWHWPLFSFFDLYTGRRASPEAAAVLVGAAMAAAWLSWHLVERPLRSSAGRLAPPWRSLRTALVAITVFAGAGAALAASSGLPQRLPADAAWADAQGRRPEHARPGCNAADLAPRNLEACVYPQGAGLDAEVLLWGDSHADAWSAALAGQLAENGLRMRQVTKNGCAPLFGATTYDAAGDADDECRKFDDEVDSLIATHPQLKTVVLSARWGRYAGRKLGPAAPRYLTDDQESTLGPGQTEAVLRRALLRTLDSLRSRGLSVIVIGPNPEFESDPTRCIARARWRGLPATICERTRTSAEQEVGWADRLLRSVTQARPQAAYLSTIDAFCTQDACSALGADGTIWYFDEHHLRSEGAQRVLSSTDFAGMVARTGTPSQSSQIHEPR